MLNCLYLVSDYRASLQSRTFICLSMFFFVTAIKIKEYLYYIRIGTLIFLRVEKRGTYLQNGYTTHAGTTVALDDSIFT